MPNPYEKAPKQAKKRTYVRNQAQNTGKTPKNEALVSVWVGSHATCEYFDYAKNQTCYNAYVLELSTFAPVPHTHPYMTHISTLTHRASKQWSSGLFKYRM